MKPTNAVLLPLGIFLFQFFLTEFLSINTIRPDFIFIYILYFSISKGSFFGVLTGFGFGLLTDLVGVGSLFGLSSIIYSIEGYLAGYLKEKYSHIIPAYFHLAWIMITIFCFFILVYVRYNALIDSDITTFMQKCFLTTGYTLSFIAILQIIIPLKRIA